ncbi:DNA-binding protein [Mortierella sp. GBAus27b]|nr:DNA-binding protein [Mortierella sp. GBAus27b]
MNDHDGRVVVADVLCEFLEVAIHMILFVRGIYPPELFESTQKYGCPIKTARHPALISYIQQVVRSIRVELQKDSIHRICVVTLGPNGQALERFVFEASMLRAFDERLLQSSTGSSLSSNGNGNQDQNSGPDKGKGRAVEDVRESDHSRKGGRGGADIYEDHYQGDHEDASEDEERLHRMTARERLDRLRQKRQQEIRPPHSSGTVGEGPKFNGMMTLTTDVEWMLKAMLLKIGACSSYLKPLVHDCSFTVLVEMKTSGPGPDAKPDFPWSPISAAVPSERSKLPSIGARPSPSRKIIPVKTIDIADIQLELFIEQLDR